MTDFKATEKQSETNKNVRDDEVNMADIENVDTSTENSNDDQKKKNQSFKFDFKGLIEFDEKPRKRFAL